jgi:DNA-binding transcriptional LysR family regulator
MSSIRLGARLRSVNLNLLPILEALLANRSVTGAAARLHMSQSAVSDALARLRHQFRDELLVHRGRGMTLTPLAQQLLPPLQEIVGRIDTLVTARPFAPGDLEREFVVATADPVIMAIGAGLMRHLREYAPRASVRFVDLDVGDYGRLRALDLDLVILPRGFLNRDQLIEQPLYQEFFVCIARRGHPRIPSKLTRKLYESLPHVSYRADSRSKVSMDARLLGLAQHDVLMVPSFSLLPLMVEQTDAIALVQRRIAERFAATGNIALHDPPVPIPPLDVCMYWSAAHDSDPANGWLRNAVLAVAQAL